MHSDFKFTQADQDREDANIEAKTIDEATRVHHSTINLQLTNTAVTVIKNALLESRLSLQMRLKKAENNNRVPPELVEKIQEHIDISTRLIDAFYEHNPRL